MFGQLDFVVNVPRNCDEDIVQSLRSVGVSSLVISRQIGRKSPISTLSIKPTKRQIPLVEDTLRAYRVNL